ncbi:MAG: glycosyltransferase [Bacteroidetes bacterium]|nr:glycosyltransferase [Bacteroidota bacterium]
MDLSIIIVNYNVKYFLEQAIASALRAIQNLQVEIIVVDNNSTDGSVEFIHQKFPEIQLIANKNNVGFSTANNQGIHASKGRYVLLLNPDTVVPEDTFQKCIHFMDQHPEAGALGVKMLDGTGTYLPESKRGFPNPEVAFYKAFGLAALFPKSKVFGKYHLGYLDKNTIDEVDVLAGAFMLIRKETLDKTGLLDETFFMYGEDIDLSYRIVKAGYKNYYFPDAPIIHYKGESTKKGSLNYVRMFYNAMKIFARKHFSGSNAGAFIFLINVAIYFRAAIALVVRFTRKIAIPLLDVIIIFIGMLLIKEYWEYYVRYIDGGKYPPGYVYINIPIYIFCWIIALYFSGAYDKSTNTIKIIRGVFWGTILISAIYGFFPEHLRFSRGMILAGVAWTTFILISERYLLHFIKNKNLRFGEDTEKNIIIFGEVEEAHRIEILLQKLHLKKHIIGIITKQKTNGENILGSESQLPQLVSIFQCNELIFCAKDISYKEILHHMITLGNTLNYKIIGNGNESFVGSNSKNAAGELYSLEDEFAIARPENKRSKRLFNILFSFLLLATFPLQFIFVRNKLGLIKNIFLVLFNNKTWVGYAIQDAQIKKLPHLKTTVISVLGKYQSGAIDEKTIHRINALYATNYKLGFDIDVIINSYKDLGNTLH